MTETKNRNAAKALPTEFIYQIFSLLIAFIFVHSIYVTLIRPAARVFLQEEAAAMKIDPDYIQQSSFYVVLKDHEQEACFVLALWALAIMGFKARRALHDQSLLERDLLDLPETLPIGPEDTRELAARLDALPAEEREALPPRALLTAIERFAATRNVQDVSVAARGVCESEGDRLESELSIIRYIAWAIPSIGFIGTVRGIGRALAQAHRAVEGDITGVTENLGVAFNSTFIALVISIVLMFLIHQLELSQERLVLDTERYIDRGFIRRLKN